MSSKKCIYGSLALVAAVSFAYARPPLAENTAPSQARVVKAGEDASGEPYSPSGLFNFASVFCTGFEAPDWDLDYSICGAAFGASCPGPKCVGGDNDGLPCTSNADCPGVPAGVCTQQIIDACAPKDHAVSQNCCVGDPNEKTGWYMPDNSKNCIEPSIRNVHPSTLKGPSLQHLRFQWSADGNPPGCQGLTGACRLRIATAPERPQTNVSKRTIKYDIAFAKTPADGNAQSLDSFMGVQVHPFIFLDAEVYSYYNGYVYAYTAQDGFAVRHQIGAWNYDVPDYAQVTVTLDPCNNTACYTYAGKPNPLYPTGTATFCEAYGFTPPYGDFNGPDVHWPTTDQTVFVNGHYNDGSAVDIDNYCVVHEPCTEACCDNSTGICTDVAKGECPFKNAYPNVKCAQLGTTGFPAAACSVARGSCCDAGPRAGGACTDAVLEADCIGTQLTWTKDASCDGFGTLCNIGGGLCSCGPGLGNRQPCPGYCTTVPSGGVCSTDAECNVAGFCYAGLCGTSVCSNAQTVACVDNTACTAPGVCTTYVCNSDANCPGSSGPCVIPAVSPGGRLCTSTADCQIPATPCEEHRGACCEYVKGTCDDDVLEENCKGDQETWFKLGTCAAVLLSGECFTHQGACCDEDTFGGCEQTSENDCALLKKGVFHKLQNCDDIVCVHNAIPTVSEWGIVVLTLLLLVGAKVYFGRRQSATA